MDEKQIARFRERVERRGPDECWPWTGAVNQRGYGVGWDGKRTRLAHRIAWFLEHSAWPSDCVCHRCDNPPCCNPAHLFGGSRAENLADMRAKGRGTAPPISHRSPFDETDIRQIRQAISNRESYTSVARRYGVSSQAIRAIFLRKVWQHVE